MKTYFIKKVLDQLTLYSCHLLCVSSRLHSTNKAGSNHTQMKLTLRRI